MTSNDIGNTAFPTAGPIPDRVSAHLTAMYEWMCTGLALTAAASQAHFALNINGSPMCNVSAFALAAGVLYLASPLALAAEGAAR